MRIEDILADYKKIQSQPRATAAARPRRGIDNDLHEARLKHLCRLIARDRRGFCPVNGVLVLLPIGVAEPGGNRDEIARACRTDLTAAFAVFRLRCPVLAMICGLETMPGFEDLIKQLPPEARKKRIGQRFPLVPELAAAEVPAKVESSVESIASALFPSMVQTQFKLEGPGGEETELVLKVNTQLFRFMTGILDKRERLAAAGQGLYSRSPGTADLVRRLLLRRHRRRFRDPASIRLRRPDPDDEGRPEQRHLDRGDSGRRCRGLAAGPCPQVVFLDGHRPARSGRRGADRQEFSGQGNPHRSSRPNQDSRCGQETER